MSADAPTRMPVVFFGHGTPMHAISDNAYTRAWQHLGETLPRPKSILCVSAHWYTRGTGVTAMERPRTIHDFGGFPRELHEVEYPAPGDPALAQRVAQLLAPVPVQLDQAWGFDHGTWSVLRKVYPKADIPVVQLSIDATQPPAEHFARGRKLAPLRDEGVLIIGTGNIVHNLSRAIFAENAPAYPWATGFDETARQHLVSGDWMPLVDVNALGEQGRLAAPTPDHYLPFVYMLGAADPGEPVTFPVEGIDLGSMSMRSVVFGSERRAA